MSITPYSGLLSASVDNTCTLLQSLFTNATDETGAAITVTVQSVFSPEALALPAVLVSFEPNESMHEGSLGLVSVDTSAKGTWHIRAPNSRILLDVRTTLLSQTWFLVDALYSGISAAYAVLTNGQTIEAYIKVMLASSGLTFQKFGKPIFPKPLFSEPRPEGQVYAAQLPVIVDMETSWTSPAVAGPSTITIQNNVVTGYPALPLIDTLPPALVVNPAFSL